MGVGDDAIIVCAGARARDMLLRRRPAVFAADEKKVSTILVL
jgi:hypothetical protein